jgi:hypothetical protein
MFNYRLQKVRDVRRYFNDPTSSNQKKLTIKKRQLKAFPILILSMALIIFILIYSFERSISDNLGQQRKHVMGLWNNFKSDLSTRDSLLRDLTSRPDSLNFWLIKSIRERKKEENDLDLIFYEYKINELLMTHTSKQKQILKFNKTLNNDISKYNAMTLEYNKDFSSFPNFIVAKKQNFHRIKYFEIIYGNENKDPIERSKELPDWAKGIDTKQQPAMDVRKWRRRNKFQHMCCYHQQLG